MSVRPRVLISYWYARGWDMDEVWELLDGADIVLDSGAFSVYMSGATVDLYEYAGWLARWRGRATAAFNLDVINDPLGSARNFRLLAGEETGVPLVPVFHAGVPVRFLEEMLDGGTDYVGFGGFVENSSQRKRLLRWAAWHLRMCARRGVKAHGLGLTASYVRHLPFYSLDSSTWKMGVRRGFLCAWDDRRKQVVQVQIRNPDKVAHYREAVRGSGIDLRRLTSGQFMAPGSPTLNVDREAVDTAACRAFWKFEEHLVDRHRVEAPKGLAPHEEPGTKIYLACTSMDCLRTVMSAWRSRMEERI